MVESHSNNGNGNGKLPRTTSSPATLLSVFGGFLNGLAHLATKAGQELGEAKENQRRELAAIAQETAGELYKRIAPALHELQEFRGPSRQMDDVRRQTDEIKKLLGDIIHHLNGEHAQQEEELRQLRDGELDREVRQPLLRELCQVAKDVVKARARLLQENPEDSRAREVGVDLLERLYLDLIERLSRHGVTAYSAVPEAPFDPARHQAIRREKRPTDNPALRNNVAEEESPGFVLTAPPPPEFPAPGTPLDHSIQNFRGSSEVEIVLEKASVFLFEPCQPLTGATAPGA